MASYDVVLSKGDVLVGRIVPSNDGYQFVTPDGELVITKHFADLDKARSFAERIGVSLFIPVPQAEPLDPIDVFEAA